MPTLPELLTTLSFYAHIAYEDDYVQPFIIQAFNTVLKPGSFLLVDKPPGARYLSSVTKHLQIMQYELLPHEALLTNPTTQFGNSYTIRKALIRKHFLSQTIASWTAKNPTSSLKDHVPLTLAFELDYAEFLEDALVEAWEVQKSWERNESQEPVSREWWILKPSMSDKGQGIRLFSSQEELQNIFNEWEESNPSDDDEDAGSDTLDVSNNGQESKGLMTSRLRHFIIQPYIPPLLLPTQNNRKFHIRTYTLAVGALEVYVYADMLALFSAHPYKGPGLSNPNDNLAIHLTNTSLQTSSNQTTHQQQEQLVHTLSSLSPTSINESNPWTPSQTISQILPLTASLFRAAAAQPTSFQPLPNCFEIFGLDWLVDSDGKVWLLEVNSFPDFGQTGVELGERIVGGFWRGVVGVVGGCWFGDCVVEDMTGADDRVEGGEYVGRGMWKVLDVDMGRR